MIAEREEEKKKKALATRKAWEANDENRKELIKCKKREEKEKEKKLQEVDTFLVWHYFTRLTASIRM